MSEKDIVAKLKAAQIWMRRPDTDEVFDLDAMAEFMNGRPVGILEEAADEIKRLQGLYDRCKLEARIHAQEARTANHTIAEIYQACTGATGEPGNWNGAAPVKEALSRALTRAAEMRERIEQLEGALRVIAGSSDRLIALQAAQALDNIGAAT